MTHNIDSSTIERVVGTGTHIYASNRANDLSTPVTNYWLLVEGSHAF